MLSPILTPNYKRDITLPFEKLPIPAITNTDTNEFNTFGFNEKGTIGVYKEQDNLVFLYTNGIKNAVIYDIKKGSDIGQVMSFPPD